MRTKRNLPDELILEVLSYKDSQQTLKSLAIKFKISSFKVREILYPDRIIFGKKPIDLVPIENLDFETDGNFDIDKWSKIVF